MIRAFFSPHASYCSFFFFFLDTRSKLRQENLASCFFSCSCLSHGVYFMAFCVVFGRNRIGLVLNVHGQKAF